VVTLFFLAVIRLLPPTWPSPQQITHHPLNLAGTDYDGQIADRERPMCDVLP
jgi:hypothetical protein